MNKRFLIFHPAVAPYRVDFFNALHDRLGAVVSLYYKNLKSQKFDYEKLKERFHFRPVYFKKSIRLGGRTIYIGHIPLIRRVRPDTVIVGEYGAGMWAAILYRMISGRKYRLVSICDDSPDMAEKCSGARRISRDLGMKYLDGLVLCSEEMCRWYRDRYTISCVSFPIIAPEEEFFRDRNEAMAQAAGNIGRYGLRGKRVFLFVGRLSPEKNIPYLVKAFAADHEKHPENMLFIIGGQSDKDPGLSGKLVKMIGDAGAGEYIRLLGRLEGTKLKSWYYTGQVLVLPSTHEPFGAVVSEALMAGEYVMVSKYAGAASLVDGDNGEVIDVDGGFPDFSKASRMPVCGEEDIRKRDSRMKADFGREMDKLIKWLT